MSCDPYLNVKSRQEVLFHSAPFSLVPAQTIFSYATVVGGCVEYNYPFNIKDMSVLEGRLKTDFLESKEGKIRLRRRHKYCTQVIGQMASSAGEKTFFVVWTTKGEPLIELIHFDLQHWKAVLANLVIFFNTHSESFVRLKRSLLLPSL